MNTVEPIRDYNMILDITDYFKEQSERNYVMWCMGIYAPIRISDILPLQVRDVRNKTYLAMREKKTGNEQLIPINGDLRKILDKYIKGKEDYEYLFPSRKNQKAPISRQQAYNIMNQAAEKFGLQKIGCHTMRKTFGYHYYQQTGDIMTLQDIFNHSNISITKRYIGLTQDIKNRAVNDFRYKRLEEKGRI
ncbi:site-specific integrase [Anaerotalea alkaliphila]|uniref:Site-specific integrase n=1 Tax=Anaerotalea alkaliphila TaxID=2662126 RepID=A0A7X5HXK2_9FIRM|nr:site-specific integrase [Anaerotalea alkaliphila]NDL68510.1 site-specific integrase [Anaerotalea alkaliphila]